MIRYRSTLLVGLVLLFVLLLQGEIQASPQGAEPGRSSPNLLWDHRYNGPGSMGNCDIGKGICIGSDGNFYCTGQASVDDSSGSDLVILSLAPDGTERWAHLYDAGNGFDIGYSIAADEEGNVYAAGDSAFPNGDADFTVVSVDSAGNERWVYRYDGGARGMDSAFDIAVGADGNIYAGGICTVDDDFYYDMCLVSLAPDGTERWIRHYNGPANHGDAVWSVAAGSDGNIYVGGKASMIFWDDFIVASFAPDGQMRWAYVYNGTANNEDGVNQVIQGNDGNIYAVGKTSETGRSRELAVISLTPDGQERWIYLYNGSMGLHDVGMCIVHAPDGNLYVGGKSVESGGDAFTIISLTTSGAERWKWLPTWSGYNGVYSIAADSESNVYACGWMGEKTCAQTRYDFTIGMASVNSEGAERWHLVYGDPDTISGISDELVFDAGNDAAYAVGMTNSSGFDSEFVVLCVDADPLLDVAVTLTPQNPPIVIGPSGGTFWYNVAIANNEPTAATFDTWIDTTLPSGALYPLLGPYAVTMNAGENRDWDLTQYVPPWAPAGIYSFNAHVGVHPDKTWSSDSFTFEKLP